jgi:hypothetical protein
MVGKLIQNYEVGKASLIASKHSPDLSNLKSVRIDEKTVIFIKAFQDKEQARANFIQRVREQEQIRKYRGSNVSSKPKQTDTELSVAWAELNTD